MVQLALAHLSDSRNGYYPKTTAKQEDIAAAARMSLPRLKAVMAELLAKGRVFIAEKGAGQNPHTYELPIRGVLKTSEQEVSESIPLIREKPYAQNSCADLHCTESSATPVVVPFPPQPTAYPAKRRAKP
jgi:hypothetical protein